MDGVQTTITATSQGLTTARMPSRPLVSGESRPPAPSISRS